MGLPFEVFGNGVRVKAIPVRFPNPNLRPDVPVGEGGVGMQVNNQRVVPCSVREDNFSRRGRLVITNSTVREGTAGRDHAGNKGE